MARMLRNNPLIVDSIKELRKHINLSSIEGNFYEENK